MKEVVIRKSGEWYCIYPRYLDEDKRTVVEHSHCKNPLDAVNEAMEYLHNTS